LRHKYITRATGQCNQDFKFKPSQRSNQRWLDEWWDGREQRPGAVNFLSPPWYDANEEYVDQDGRRKKAGVPQFDKGGFITREYSVDSEKADLADRVPRIGLGRRPAISTWGGPCGSGVNPNMPKNYRGKSREELLEVAEKAQTLSAQRQVRGDTRWHGKMYEKKSKQPPNVYPHLERAYRGYSRNAVPALAAEITFAKKAPDLDKPKSPCVFPTDEHAGNTGASFFLNQKSHNALHPKTEKAAKAAERERKKAAKSAKPRLTWEQWDEHASLAKSGDQRALKILWREALPFATALATPFCRRNTSLSAEALAIEAIYPLSKKTGMPIFGLTESLNAWEPGGGRAFVWYLRDLIEKNIKKSLRGEKFTLSLDQKTGAYHDGILGRETSYIDLVADGDGIFDGDGFDVEAAIVAFDELEADLTDTERRVLTCHRNGETDKKIGDGLRVSRERARQIRISAIDKLTR
jgi:DNA-directed RNA polymerase specialized sigma subunit